MPTTPSPLRYPGGKTAYAPMLRQIIQDNKINGCDYVEPFAGGAGAALTLLLSKSVNAIWLNDLDVAIYSFWKAVIDYTDDFINKLWNTPISIVEWKKQRKIYKNEKEDILLLGFATLYLNRCNRAGILSANPVGGITPYLNRSKYRIWARFNRQSLTNKIETIANLKDRINLSNEDARIFLARFHTYNKNVLVYFDPPYFQKGSLLYMNSLKNSEHCALSHLIRQCKYKWLLSYDDQPRIRELYADINMYRKKRLNYSVTAPSIGMELVISPLKKMPQDLEPVIFSDTAG
ncbi:MAG: DNA adenine methylase [Planctomycetota bacterium]|jgi:DNA adenine methylase|nr:DNA adenine methylase [Planctomycetota bacterium]